MPTSLYVYTAGDLIYVKPDGSNRIRTYEIYPNGTISEVNESAIPMRPEITRPDLNRLDPDSTTQSMTVTRPSPTSKHSR